MPRSGIVAALHERTRTGAGRVVRTSLLASVVGAHAFQGTRWTIAGQVPVATGNHHPAIAPYGAFRCRRRDDPGRRGQRAAVAALRAGRGPRSRRRPVRPQRPAGHPARRADRRDRAGALRRGPGALAGAARAGRESRPGRSARIDEVYQWAQTRSQGLVITWIIRSSARSSCPARCCASTASRLASTLRRRCSASTTRRCASGWLRRRQQPGGRGGRGPAVRDGLQARR